MGLQYHLMIGNTLVGGYGWGGRGVVALPGNNSLDLIAKMINSIFEFGAVDYGFAESKMNLTGSGEVHNYLGA